MTESPRQDTVEGIELVHRAVQVAAWDDHLAPEGGMDAEGLCRVVLELAVDQFGNGGKEKLIEWNLQTSEDVGRVVGKLVSNGMIDASEADQSDDFRGLFDLNQPPDHWKIRW